MVSAKNPIPGIFRLLRRQRPVRRLGVFVFVCWMSAGALFAQNTPLVPLDQANAIPFQPRLDVLFLMEQSPAVDEFDPTGYRIEGIRKILSLLHEGDRAGLVLFDGQTRLVQPLRPVSSDTRAQIIEAASNVKGYVTGAQSVNLRRPFVTAFDYFKNRADPMRTPVAIAISAAVMDPNANRDTLSRTYRKIATRYEQLGIVLLGVRLGEKATEAGLMTAGILKATNHWDTTRSEELPAVFSAMVPSVQARPDPVIYLPMKGGETAQRTFQTSPFTEMLQFDVVTKPDSAGVVPVRVTLTDPNGDPVLPRLVSDSMAFYSIPSPGPGTWTFSVSPSRDTTVEYRVLPDSGTKIRSYFPQVVLVKRTALLHFGITMPDGTKVTKTRFTVEPHEYRIARGFLNIESPDGTTKTMKAELIKGNGPPFDGEYRVRWRPQVAGIYTLRPKVYLRREDDRVLYLERPIKIRVTDKESELPVVALVEPKGGAPLPSDPPTALAIKARIVDAGGARYSPFMLGRFVDISVQYGSERRQGPGTFTLGGTRKTILPMDRAYLLPDASVPGEVLYSFPGPVSAAGRPVYLREAGYYQIELLEGSTYRVDPARREVTLRVGGESLDVRTLGLIALGLLVTAGGGFLYVMVERGMIDFTPPPPPPPPEDVLIEDEQFEYTDVLTQDSFKVPQNIPLEIAAFQDGVLVNHTYFEQDMALGGNYVVRVLRGSSYVNDSPVTDDFDFHMRPNDRFRIGDMHAEIIGIEEPFLVIQFQVEEVGEQQVVNAATENEGFRWTITAPQEKRIPPQPGETRTLDFTDIPGGEGLYIARDEGFSTAKPYDFALYHETVGNPHAKITKTVYVNLSVGYGIEAIKGSLYVDDQRLEPGEQVEEFPPGSTIRIGAFRFRFSWDAETQNRPTLEFIESPPPEPFPLPTPFAEVGQQEEGTDAETAEGEELDLDALFGQADDNLPSEATSLEDLEGVTTEAGSLDNLPSESPPAGEQPEGGEEAVSLEDLMAQDQGAATPEETASLEDLMAQEEETAAPEEAAPPQETTEEETTEAAEEGEPGGPEEGIDEAPTLEALFGEEAPSEAAAPEEAPPLEVPEEEMDAPTGLPAPAHLEEQLDEDWEAAAESGVPLALILVDVGRAVSDSDDELVPEVARLLRERFGQVGFLARADVTLFSIVLPNVPFDEATEVAGLVRSSLTEAFPDAANEILVGVTERDASGSEDARSFIPALHDAMEEGIAAGQNFVVYG